MGIFESPEAEPHDGGDPIAIIGMACRLPGDSNSPQSLWEMLEQGRCATTGVPESRFNLDGHFDGSRKPNTLKSPGAMFLENVDLSEFDAQFFSISKQEALAMDPQQRQLLEVVYECLENSGVTLQAISGAPVGCFVASSTNDYRDVHARDPEDRPANATVGLVPAILSNRLSHFLNLKGPSMTIDTACSASLVSLDVANKYIQAGEISAAVVAGVHLWLSPEANMDSGAMREAFSSSGKCHAFDAKADGYTKAEGVNAVYVKRLRDAIRDGDPVRAVIRGSATNSDGRTPGIANPSSKAQEAAIRAAYANAGLSADMSATSYLECHGTGTLAGDPVEVQAASSALCQTRGEDPLLIGSIKSNVGHSECSAGISGVIKTILALEKGVIPGNPTFVTPNPKIDFHKLKLRASRTPSPWPNVPLRRASVNSFGFGGSNAHAILEEARPWAKLTHVSSYKAPDELDDFFAEEDGTTKEALSILVFSANDENSLISYVDVLRRHLMYPVVHLGLQDLAYTLSERRTHHFHRGFIVTDKSVVEPKALISGKKNAEALRIGFVFTGQGAQWSQMGKLLMQRFPLAGDLLRFMDSVLQNSHLAPSWSLLGELTESRSGDHLRQPELSQPLVTALQIMIVEVLRSWNICPQAAAGHSSGEIAAAYCAGYISMEDAIKIAFYRGQASVKTQRGEETTGGMLAIGLGPQGVLEYLANFDTLVIACFNSPNSITLSGDASTLAKIEARLKADGHFARMLHVDLAYHSGYMSRISDEYKRFLDQDVQTRTPDESQIPMFSSVSGEKLEESPDSSYWRRNMASPVQFDQAVRSMTAGKSGANFLVEIGPSGTLAGPISEIKASLPQQGSHIRYLTAFRRDQRDLRSLFEVAGQLFISGAEVDLAVINKRDHVAPRCVIDLPNYTWNHSTRYWYESEASKDWRFRLFPPHDLIGSKIIGTSWHAPVWKKNLKVSDIPWLKDHKLGSDIVVPGAAMVVMAVEAMNQLARALHHTEGKPLPHQPCYRVRNATFSRALILEEGDGQPIMLALGARTGSRDSWYEFKIHSLVNHSWLEHSKGLVRMEEDRRKVAPRNILEPLCNSTPGALWYQAMEDVGYALGPAFQKHLEAESVSGSRNSRSTVSLHEPPSKFAQTRYQMHPTSVDAILQACAPGLWNGNRTNINAVIIPTIIDDVVICSQPSSTTTGMVVVSSHYSGVGDPDATKNYTADVDVYDTDTGLLLFQLSKLRTSILNTRAVSHTDPTYCSLSWKPDLNFFTQDAFSAWCKQHALDECNDHAVIKETLKLAAFKTPALKIFEAAMVPEDSRSVWMDTDLECLEVQSGAESFQFAQVDAKTLLAAQERYQMSPGANSILYDITKYPPDQSLVQAELDLVILRVQAPSITALHTTLRNAHQMLKDGGHLLLLDYKGDDVSDHAFLDSSSLQDLENTWSVPLPEGSPMSSALLARKRPKQSASPVPKVVDVLHFDLVSDAHEQIITGLKQSGWTVKIHSYPFTDVDYEGITLVLDNAPLLSTITQEQWASLQLLLSSQNRILWLTEGSQFEVSRPENAQIHGLIRTIHDEDPSINITTLDLDRSCGPHTAFAVDTVLCSLQTSTFQKTADYEFAERRGTLYISRVLPDAAITKFSKAEEEGADLTTRPLFGTDSQINLICERVGNLDSLLFHEISADVPSLNDGEVEVEIAAVGLNFKDIAISTGLIPGNERLLGFEGAGIVRRSRSSSYRLGQRVVYTKPGSFGNRIIVESEFMEPLPDFVSFEEAATLGAVYPVALYSLFDLADTRKGSRVLVHSAAGGVGIACIQLCQHVGAELFVTVGNEEKRRHLITTFGLHEANIFNSRSSLFAEELMKATDGEGVDVIVNSLTGDLLEESWNCIRDGGTMVELGKRDIIERNYLPMGPFSRGVSYRSFDISLKSIPKSVMSRLLKQTLDLVSGGHIKPVYPTTVFPFDKITSAFRYMRDGKHMGKIVISNQAQLDVKVPVRPLVQRVKLRDDVAYVIVGGLKGLCGSIALSFARHGAKHLIIMGRSGFGDKASQTTIRNVEAERCKIHLVRGDVTVPKDVQKAFNSASVPVGGVLQGSMVVRGKLYQAMTADDYHVAVACKVRGTWNLHNAALDEGHTLDFFSMLSSTSGVAGQSGQANYVAANAFLDAFAIYRRQLGLRANSIALGPMWDVGYMSRNRDTLPTTNVSTFTTITESLFHKIIDYSILQQTNPINEESAAHLITGMAIPLKESSTLRSDARFAGLFGSSSSTQAFGAKGGSKEMQVFNLLFTSQADPGEILTALTEVVGQKLAAILQLNDRIESAKPPSDYGMESLAAVELRNWARMELEADVTMLEILGASSLSALCGKMLTKMKWPTQ